MLLADDLRQLQQDGLPCTEVAPGTGLVEVLVASGLARSNRVARELIGSQAVRVNGHVTSDTETSLSTDNSLHGRYFVLKRGKKQFHLAKLRED